MTERKFRVSLATTRSLYYFWKEAGNAALKLNIADISANILTKNTPKNVASPKLLRVQFNVLANLRDGTEREFVNLVIDLPSTATNAEMVQAMNDLWSSSLQPLYSVKTATFITVAVWGI